MTKVEPAQVVNLDEIASKEGQRLKTDIAEVDRVLGGGIVPGSLILLSGEPGIGKSTILTQIVDTASRNSKSVCVYASGEESGVQVKGRLERLNCDLKNFTFVSETNIEKLIAAVLNIRPKIVVLDSVQTFYSSVIPSEAGGINQIRAVAVKLLELAKKEDISVILVGHITKDGSVAGPKSLEHIVDTVLYLEAETSHDYRILRVTKNRFGSVNEVGIFEMTGQGFKEVANPSAVFIDEQAKSISGSAIGCIVEGTRPFFIEVQALVTKTVFGYPQRKASGFDLNRLQVLTAVLTKRAKVNLSNQDVILNIVGGMKISDPSLDLAVCFAIISSLLNQTVSRKTIIIGEVGLGGEIRATAKLKEKLTEAAKLGFERAIIPNSNINIDNFELVTASSLLDVVNMIGR
jgi:DNA repair protein RadA/Sms